MTVPRRLIAYAKKILDLSRGSHRADIGPPAATTHLHRRRSEVVRPRTKGMARLIEKMAGFQRRSRPN